MMPDFFGGLIGMACLITLVLTFHYADDLGDGNVGATDDQE